MPVAAAFTPMKAHFAVDDLSELLLDVNRSATQGRVFHSNVVEHRKWASEYQQLQ